MNLGVYIQVPFCQTKCTYCNFHTGVVAREKYGPYAEAVRREIAELAASGEISILRDAAVDTVYFGGHAQPARTCRARGNSRCAAPQFWVRAACTAGFQYRARSDARRAS